MSDPPRTLGDLADRELGLVFECPQCRYSLRMFLDAMIVRHGRDLPFAGLARTAVCGLCGRRGATPRIAWPSRPRPRVF